MSTGQIAIGVQIAALLIMLTAAGTFILKSAPWLALIPGISAISYWNMIYTKEKTEMYRYSDWFLTTPLMLLALLSQNNVTNSYIHIVLVLNMIMIVAAYYATKTEDSKTKSMWFALRCLLFIPIAYVLYSLPIEKQASIFLCAVWSIYPIIWILKERHILKPDISNIAYAFIDTVSKVGLLSQLHI